MGFVFAVYILLEKKQLAISSRRTLYAFCSAERARYIIAAASLANKHVLRSTHPSPLSANRATATLPAFMGSRPYSQVNRILEKAGEQPIDWQSVLAG